MSDRAVGCDSIFRPGQRVQVRSDRSRVGIIAAEGELAGGAYWYEVELPDGSTRHFPESNLTAFEERRDPQGLFTAGAFGDELDLIRLVTFHKLDTPLDNVLYSLEASRTEFYPHQYKPLVKFLDSRNQRLLVADEVGLGKTIEAGIILIEQRARGALDQVLVVCPAALRLKWKEEMWNRFDEEFQILTSEQLRELIHRYHSVGELGRIRGIIPLQSLRQRGNIALLEASPLPVDLLIVDEAHHLRNRSTLAHKVVRDLADQASAVLLLTATPIQLGNENLFSLLQLLDPGEFEDLGTFQERLQANQPVIQAERFLRSQFPPPADEVLDRFAALKGGWSRRFFLGNPLLESAERRFGKGTNLTRKDVVRIQEDLKDLNLLSHIFSRSRKREVFPNAPERSAPVIPVAAAPEELDFYWAVTEFVRGLRGGEFGSVGYLAAVQAQRQVASCVQAARELFVQRALERVEDSEADDMGWNLEMDLDPEGEDDPILSPPERLIEAARALGSVDSKLQGLLDALAELDHTEPNRKIILFSFFKRTLHYLKARLEEAGYSCELISGDVRSHPTNPELDERGHRIKRFRDPNSGVRILLSSEVGSEGLDFQFTNVMVNYDLPWNPMRVEQRIGRLDRIGQEADRIIILNLYLPGTIEDRILHRLHERIGIFRESIGDLETILGDEIQELSRDLLTNQLSPEEESARIDEAAAAIELRIHQFRRLEVESDRFMGHDHYFTEQLEKARTGGELLAPKDLETFFFRFLKSHHPRTRVSPASEPGVFILDVDSSLETAIRMAPAHALNLRFLHRVRGGALRISFRAGTAYRDETVEYLGPHHPLIRVACKHYQRHPEELHPVSIVRLDRSEYVPSGTFLYGLFDVDIRTGRLRKRLQPLYLGLPSGEVLDPDAASGLLGEMLRSGGSSRGYRPEGREEMRECFRTLEEAFRHQVAEEAADLQIRNQSRVQTRLASLKSSHEVRIGMKETLLQDALRHQKSESYIRMLKGTIRNMEAKYQARMGEIQQEQEVEISFGLIGCGLLIVEG